MNSLYKWFGEVWIMVKMWWGLGVLICLLDATLAFLKLGTIAAFMLAFSKSALLLFVIGPVLIGSAFYLIKTYTRWL